MWKWLKRFIVTAFVLAALPCIAFTGLMIWVFSPTFALGRGINELSFENQVAYLILVDQMHHNAMLKGWRSEGGKLPVALGTSEDCASPDAELREALAGSWAFSKISFSPPDCSSLEFLYVARDFDGYRGGYLCGGLCGEGNFYFAIRPFGIVMVLRSTSFVN